MKRDANCKHAKHEKKSKHAGLGTKKKKNHKLCSSSFLYRVFFFFFFFAHTVTLQQGRGLFNIHRSLFYFGTLLIQQLTEKMPRAKAKTVVCFNHQQLRW